MALLGTVEGASPGVLGFDTDSPVTPHAARQFVTQGFHFCIRYLSRGPQQPKDLSAAEADVILDAGLALTAVQHVRKAPWQPSALSGREDGTSAAQNSVLIGFPPGVNVWCDLEGVQTSASAADVIEYCDAWYIAVRNVGYLPGLYVGANAILDSQQLTNLQFQAYWRSLSSVPNVRRGYRLIQLYPSVSRNGISIDIDVTQNDYRSGQVQWLIRPPAG